ncbi:hypothetical protein PIB30_051652 [Stylosanthes scabra]|uniref:Uncharacterized protein n=1 Tax=Stylosanthes scabra TaxID=79078 RepID=A0ABU6WHU0_9FABA|nr:hypothetical protein [Stylosanthes scabra]
MGNNGGPRIRHGNGDEAEAETVDRRRHNKEDDRRPSSVGVRIGEGRRGNGRRRRKNKEIGSSTRWWRKEVGETDGGSGRITEIGDHLTEIGRRRSFDGAAP